MSNDTVMIRLQKDTYGRGFNLESAARAANRMSFLCQPLSRVVGDFDWCSDQAFLSADISVDVAKMEDS